jgi:putative peptidoglycan lipid II flippase
MVTLIPIVAMMTVGGPAIGSALFAYGNFGEVDAGYLGMAITLSAFTLVPYALVLLQLRVFYAREQPWTPILLIVVITTVKIAGSLIAPYLTDDPELVAGYLGLANGLGFLAGATVGYFLLRVTLNPPGGRLISLAVVRTVLVTVAASLIAGLVAHVVDQLLGLEALTTNWGGAGSLLRLFVLGMIMVPIVAWVLLAARVPDADAALAAVRRRFGRRATVAVPPIATPDRPRPGGPLTYADQRNSAPSRHRQSPAAARRGPPASVAGDWMTRGQAVTDDQATGAAAGPDGTATTKIPRPSADDFTPDVPTADFEHAVPEPEDTAAFAEPANSPPTTAAIPPVSPSRSPRRGNHRSSPPPPMRTYTSFLARPSAAGATGCCSSTAAHPACSSGRHSTRRWTGRSR